jgi:hypothetical protein
MDKSFLRKYYGVITYLEVIERYVLCGKTCDNTRHWKLYRDL